jgi:lipid-A-disaccharide synthase
VRVLLSCGEPSGDLYAGALASEILRRVPDASIAGLGGPQLAAAGGRLIADYRGLAVTGLAEALAVLPRSWRVYRQMMAEARAQRPDVFVAIDFPDFNFRLARAVHRLGIPVVYYISPQLWAWRSGRIHTMRRVADRVLVIFPFEEAIYRDAGVPVQFVGHPLVDLIRPSGSREELRRSLGLSETAPTVALLPGSRPNEVTAILPTIVRAGLLMRRAEPRLQFVVARAPGLPDGVFAPLESLRRAADAPVPVVESRTDDVLTAADVVITASGTATVQAALHERPMVIVYRVSPVTYALGRRFVKVDTFGMANLIAGHRVVPELIQERFTEEAVATEAMTLLQDQQVAARVRRELADVRRKLGEPGASGRAAEAVLEVARRRA